MLSGVNCSCGKVLRVKPEWIGRRVKCPSCGAIVQVPAAQPEDSEPLRLAPKDPDPPPTDAQAECPNCHQPLAPGAVLCTQCGLDLRTGTVRDTVNGPPEADEPDPDRPRLHHYLWEVRWWIVGAVITLCAAAGAWFALAQLAHSNAGPYEVVFAETAGTALELRIFWHSANLPDEPVMDPDETTTWVNRWYLRRPDGKKVLPTWTATEYRRAVNVVFSVPPSTKIIVGLGDNHEVEIDTPAGPDERKIVLKWHD